MMIPIAVISTDWHIRPDNVELSLDLAAQQIRLAKEMEVQSLICLGDVFDSRKAQPEIVLNTFSRILDMAEEAGMTLMCIPGNHDKTDPYSETSYLTPFIGRKSFKIAEQWSFLFLTDAIVIGILPYFREDVWLEMLSSLKDCMNVYSGKKYLFSHQAVTGSVNNDGSKVQNRIMRKDLEGFEKVFLGHYHNYQQPLPNVYHLAAWKQSSFGENEDKGFYILNADENGDVDIEFRQSEFPKFITYEMDASELDMKTAKEITSQFKGSSDRVRISIKGDVAEIKSASAKVLEESGIKVKKEVELKKSEISQVKDYRKKEAMIEAFREFCDEKGYDFDEGIEYLEKAYE